MLNYLFQCFFYANFEIWNKVSVGVHCLLECAMAKSMLQGFKIYTFFQKQGVIVSDERKGGYTDED